MPCQQADGNLPIIIIYLPIPMLEFRTFILSAYIGLFFFFKFPLQIIELHMGYFDVIKSFIPLMRIECYRIKRIISFLVEEMPKALYLESRLQCFPYSMVW